METGVAGLNIEDQILKDRRSWRIIDEELMAEKIMVAQKQLKLMEILIWL